MAFANAATAVKTDDESWKAQGFINLYLPSKNGEARRKLGAIALKDSKPSEKALREWLEQDPANIAKVLGKLVMEYQSAAGSDANGFDLD